MADNEKGSVSGLISDTAKSALGEIIKASADNPNIKAAGSEVGKAVYTVAKTINVALMPLAAINYGYDRAKKYFEKKFAADLQERLAEVAADDIVEPKPSLAGPVLQGLAFSHDEDALREMYLNLLASAMNKAEASSAHPAYAEIIKQMTAKEAVLLCAVLSPPFHKEIAQIRQLQPPGHLLLETHVLRITSSATGEMIEEPNLPAIVDNWIRLGLVEVSYTEHLNKPGENRYGWIHERPEFRRHFERVQAANKQKGATGPPIGAVVPTWGHITATAFGEGFYRSVALAKISTNMRSSRQNDYTVLTYPDDPVS